MGGDGLKKMMMGSSAPRKREEDVGGSTAEKRETDGGQGVP